MNWKTIDTNEDLKALDQAICPSDSERLGYFASDHSEEFYPDDVCYSGYYHKNISVLSDSGFSNGIYVEIIFIACEWYGACYFERMTLTGQVDTLKRVELTDSKGNPELRCARMIYRFLSEDEVQRISYGRINVEAEQDYGASSY